MYRKYLRTSTWTWSKCPVRDYGGLQMRPNHLYLIAFAVALGCAPASSTSGGLAPRRTTTLTAAELRAANLEMGNAFDAISRLRPNWLTHVTESNNPPRREF